MPNLSNDRIHWFPYQIFQFFIYLDVFVDLIEILKWQTHIKQCHPGKHRSNCMGKLFTPIFPLFLHPHPELVFLFILPVLIDLV